MKKIEIGDRRTIEPVWNLTRYADTPEDVEALKWCDWLSENIAKVPEELFTELFNCFGDYGFSRTDEELKRGAYGHTLGELDQIIMKEACRRLHGRIQVRISEEDMIAEEERLNIHVRS